MSTRVIKLKVLTASAPVSIITDVRTFGEFKELAEVKALRIDWSSAKLIDRATKASFELNEAVLPEIDCIMFHTPTKSKAGSDWANASYKECKVEMKKLKDAGVEIPFNYTNVSSSVMQEFLVNYNKKSKKGTAATQPAIKQSTPNAVKDYDARIQTLVTEISERLETLKTAVAERPIVEVNNGIDEKNIVELVTIQDLDAEFAAIQKQLK